MLCPTCNQELSLTGVCPRCGVAGNPAPSQAAGDPFAAPTPQLPAPSQGHPVLIILGVVMWIGVLFFAFAEARFIGQAKQVRDIQGFFIGALIFPVSLGAGITWLINRAKKSKLSPAQKHCWAAGMALVFSFMGFSGASQQRHAARHTDVKKEVARLFSEASGKTPVSQDGDWSDSLTRDFFRSVIERNKRYSQELRQFDNSALHSLYSTESYSTTAGMQKTIAQLQAALELDQKYSTLRPLVQDMERRLKSVDASESDKQSFLEGVKASGEVLLGAQDKLVALEQKWVESSVALYQFAIDHRADYSIRGKKLLFSNHASRLEFTAKQDEAIAQHRAFLDEKAGLDRMRNNALTEIGLNSPDANPAPSPSPSAPPSPAKEPSAQ